MSQNDTVQTIAAVLKGHYVQYDGFSQDDSWQCKCDQNGKASAYQRHYKYRHEAEQHVARRIEMAISGRTVTAQDS